MKGMKMVSAIFSVFLVVTFIQKTFALTFPMNVVANQAGRPLINVEIPANADNCPDIREGEAEVWSCGIVSEISDAGPLGNFYTAPGGTVNVIDTCVFHEPVGGVMQLECYPPPTKCDSRASESTFYNFTLKQNAENCEETKLVKSVSTCSESTQMLDKLSKLELELASLSARLGDGLRYSLTLNFCSSTHKKAFDELGAKIVMTKEASASSEMFPTAWQSLQDADVLLSNTLTWEETYNLIATNQIVSDNVVVDSASSFPNAFIGSLYSFENGVFSSDVGTCSPTSYCVTNNQGKTFNIGLSQDSSNGESILGVFKVGNLGNIQMKPSVKVTVFLGEWQKNAFIEAAITYPQTSVTLGSQDPAKTLNFNPSINQFTDTPC